MKRFLIPLTLLAIGGCAQADQAVTPETLEGKVRPAVTFHPRQRVAPPPQVTATRRCDYLREGMRLHPTGRVNNFGNPIWLLRLPHCKDYTVVTGRAHTQNLDPHQSGTEAPLPPGLYRIGQVHDVRGQNPEFGNTIFIDLEPQFPTGRTDLGIHWDPSFNRDKVKDGTAGCIALTNASDLDAVADAIRRHGIRTLTVM